ncbi:MAG: bifunctional (p)ppGpp synthetase/guanosine-3',5'-bis(diphosphate) 3'-pyrophosphohydrolase [Desulfomonile tiedjei]|uniref:Bifunctional (P)ppGpp synthetase/guanosine-3',5'-bis(Diphosphate) 3'-pyrophosphohydrolase n=1 Tax=Desulfomonile tiedjei TaxID=2358 RepID=A0A9D6Z3X1_9BACT|nr:bifunctional (p)ppGpp synthetase/guanosine-3',5'-bis(diphosphate) 3'-pyrophosphohydrolase [Desulfomonile tiedjei]
MVRFGEIQDMVKAYYPDADLDLIRAAYVYSAQVHIGQTRRSGEPYLVHPVAVAMILAQMRLDEASVATGLLHDTVEDTLATPEELERFFGKEIATLVDGVTKISKIEFESKEERQAENFRKMILAMSRDIRVLLVKLADRLHNMRTLGPMPPEAQTRIARETMEIYSPLAARLGIYWIRTELEDLAFRYLNPDRFNYIKTRLQETLKQREEYVNNVIRVVREKLEQYNIKAVIKGRNKEIYSIHQKMFAQHLDFDQIHDITAFRIILNNVSECYAVLGLIHSLWRPVPGRFKDYVAMPKSNRYQSLHTTVIGPDGLRIEIQIRTNEMDLIAEEGIAAHWSYKEGKIVEAEDAKVVNWLRQMMEWQQDLEDPREFFENVRVDLYPDEVYVFTPKGEVKEFPKGATPLDFAYSIHTEVGHRCVGARVNGKMVSLKYQLRTGDSVEIITSVHQKPSKDWLKFVKTGRARTKIRHYVLTEERERAIQMGMDSTDRELRKWRLELGRAEKEGEMLKIAHEYSFKSEADLYAAIGYGRISPKAIITRLVPPSEREKAKAALAEEKHVKKERTTTKSGVKVHGLTDVMVNFAKCCNPLPGDPIRGFITRGRGVTVHKQDCINLQTSDFKRIIDVTWDEDQPIRRTVKLGLQVENKMGMLATISGVIASADSDIVQANIKTVSDHYAEGTFMISVRNLDHLNSVMNALKSIKGVRKVDRLGVI